MKTEFVKSAIISFVFLSFGIVLIEQGAIDYGVSLFVFLPFLLGIVLGKNRVKKASLIGLLFSLTIFFFLLFFGNLEGMICIIMALPLVALAMFVGFLVKREKEKEM